MQRSTAELGKKLDDHQLIRDAEKRSLKEKSGKNGLRRRRKTRHEWCHQNQERMSFKEGGL